MKLLGQRRKRYGARTKKLLNEGLHHLPMSIIDSHQQNAEPVYLQRTYLWKIMRSRCNAPFRYHHQRQAQRDDEDIGDECDADSDADDEEIEKVREGRCVEV